MIFLNTFFEYALRFVETHHTDRLNLDVAITGNIHIIEIVFFIVDEGSSARMYILSHSEYAQK